jgi:hypothetical protein
VVLWAGWPFFQRGWASAVNRSPNMFTFIASAYARDAAECHPGHRQAHVGVQHPRQAEVHQLGHARHADEDVPGLVPGLERSHLDEILMSFLRRSADVR